MAHTDWCNFVKSRIKTCTLTMCARAWHMLVVEAAISNKANGGFPLLVTHTIQRTVD